MRFFRAKIVADIMNRVPLRMRAPRATAGWHRLKTGLLGATLFALPLPAADRCLDPAWHSFEGIRGMDGPVLALHRWDPDGAGPRTEVLVAAGGFNIAGTRVAGNIAACDGSEWSPPGSGTPSGSGSTINALATLPDGQLVAAGTFTSLGGTAAFRIEAAEGQPYSIRHSDDLRSWHTILGPTAGPQEFNDTDPARQSRCTGFYDVAAP